MKEFIVFTKLDSWYMEEKLQLSKKSRETSVLCLETINHVGCTMCVRWFCLFVENEIYEWKNSAILTNFRKPNAALTIQQQHKHQGQNFFFFTIERQKVGGKIQFIHSKIMIMLNTERERDGNQECRFVRPN